MALTLKPVWVSPLPGALFILKRLSRVCAGLVFAIGMITVLAWLFYTWLFGAVFPPDRLPFILSIKCNTGLGFSLLGIALWLSGAQRAFSPGREATRKIAAACAALLGLATLLEYLTGWNSGLDQWLVRDSTVLGNLLPGRMRVGTALDFCLMGSALAFPGLKIPRKIQVASLFSLVSLFIALLAFIGHLYGAKSLYVYSPFNYMGLQTSLAFIFAAVGFLTAYPQRIFGRHAGSSLDIPLHSSLNRGLGSFAWTGLSMILIFLMASAWISAENFFGLLRNDRMIIHSQQVLDSLEKVRASVNDVTTSAHDYFQSGKKTERTKFEKAQFEFHDALNTVLALTADNPRQQTRLMAMGQLLDSNAATLRPFFHWRSAAAEWTFTRQQQVLQIADDFRDHYRDLLVGTRQEENDLLALRAAEADQSIRQTGWAFIFTLGTAIVFILCTLSLWRRDSRRQSQLTETELKLTTIIQNAPMIFFTFNPQGVISVSQGKALENLGIGQDQSVGKSIFDLYRDVPEILQNTRRAIRGEKFTALVEVNRKTLEMSYSPVRDNQGHVTQVIGVALDVSGRMEAERALQSSEANYREIFEKANEGILVQEMETGRLIDMNRRASKILGYDKEEFMSRNPLAAEGVPGFGPQEGAQWVKKAVTQGPQLFEWQGRRKDGALIWIEVSLTRAVIAGKERLLAFFRDIGDRKSAQEKLQHYTHRLEDNNRNLQEFVYVASHDLQEPLRKIQAFSGFLAQELGSGVSEEGQRYMARIRDGAARMGTLIQDLLQWTRVSTRAMPFESVDLSSVLKDVVGDLEMALKDSGGQVQVGNLPVIDADRSQMWQLFQNLISNSLKFHKNGTPPAITLEAKVQPSANRVTVTVRDNGIGFEQKYAEKIFTIFQRLHGPQDYKGSGVGLAVCRKVAERHNGTISAKGVLGEGAVFEITLPLRQVEITPPVIEKEPVLIQEPESQKV